MKINNKLLIGKKNSPFIIAEISANHDNNFDRLLTMVDAAAEAGASAVKIQTINPKEITLNSDSNEFTINNENSKWHGKKFYDIYKEATLPLSWHKKVFARAKKNKIIAFSTPFDEKSVDFLARLGTPLYKIASFENEHFPLIKKISTKNKPVIMSLGMLSLKQIYESVKYLKKCRIKSFALLKCTSLYPAPLENLNLASISDLKKKFNCEIGFSDHTTTINSSIAAVAQGATIIEKHFVLSKKDNTLDSHFSVDFNDLKELVIGCKEAHKSIGSVSYKLSKSEKIASKNKRTIRACMDIVKGTKFTNKNIKVVRPGGGLKPKVYPKIIGKKAKSNIKFGEKIKIQDF